MLFSLILREAPEGSGLRRKLLNSRKWKIPIYFGVVWTQCSLPGKLSYCRPQNWFCFNIVLKSSLSLQSSSWSSVHGLLMLSVCKVLFFFLVSFLFPFLIPIQLYPPSLVAGNNTSVLRYNSSRCDLIPPHCSTGLALPQELSFFQYPTIQMLCSFYLYVCLTIILINNF